MAQQIHLPPSPGGSDDLAGQHRRHGGKEGDREGREGILALGHGDAGDYTGTESSHSQLGDKVAAGAGGRSHGARTKWRDPRNLDWMPTKANGRLLPGVLDLQGCLQAGGWSKKSQKTSDLASGLTGTSSGPNQTRPITCHATTDEHQARATANPHQYTCTPASLPPSG